MPATYRSLARFDKALKRKEQTSPALAAAVLETVRRVVVDPRNRGLNAHLVDRKNRIWEAYINDSARLTYQRHGDTIIFRNNCRHDIIDDGHW